MRSRTQQTAGKRNNFFTQTTAQTNQSRSISIKEATPKEERDAHTNDGEGDVPGVERGSLAVRRRCECGIPLELLLPRHCGRHTSGRAIIGVGHQRLRPRLVPCRSLSAPQRVQRRHLRAFPAHLHKHLRAHLRGPLRREGRRRQRQALSPTHHQANAVIPRRRRPRPPHHPRHHYQRSKNTAPPSKKPDLPPKNLPDNQPPFNLQQKIPNSHQKTEFHIQSEPKIPARHQEQREKKRYPRLNRLRDPRIR
jgi:hypothetical protein